MFLNTLINNYEKIYQIKSLSQFKNDIQEIKNFNKLGI